MNENVAIDYRAVVAEIRAELARQEIPAQQLAARIGMNQSTMSRRLNGSPFTLMETLAICAALRISLRDLLSEAEKHRPQPVEAGTGAAVAGARFELATSGLRTSGNVVQLPDRPRPVVEHDWYAPVVAIHAQQDAA